MKVIVAGTRDLGRFITKRGINDSIHTSLWDLVDRIGKPFTEVVSGASGDVDIAGEGYATAIGKAVKLFPADWDAHGRAAGPIRNKQMAEYADALVLVWDGKSRGSSSMLSEARQAGLPIVQVVYHRTIKREGLEALSGPQEE